MSSRVKVFCFFYNEEKLIPFFLRHYRYADIHAFVSKSIDSTCELLAAAPNVTLQNVEFPDGLDDDIKTAVLNEALSQPDPDHDWHIILDSDEFIWPQGMDPLGFPDSTPDFLNTIPSEDNCVIARMNWVYRHKDDADLDPSLPVAVQRRHGNPGFDWCYSKKIVIRSNQGLHFDVGNHNIHGNAKLSSIEFRGAHWQMADPSFCVTRRVRDRSEHGSTNNKNRGYGGHNFNLAEATVIQQCQDHLNDPLVF
jgi:hypothetical protein